MLIGSRSRRLSFVAVVVALSVLAPWAGASTVARAAAGANMPLYEVQGPGRTGSSSPLIHTAAIPTAPGAFKSLAPARLLDTRSGSGAPRAAVRPSGTVVVQVAGRGGVSASNVSAVAINITATSPTASGYLTAYASGAARPTASNLNFAKGQTVANLVIVPVGADGKIRVFNGSGGTVQLLADVAGYYLSGTPTAPGAFKSLAPARLLDTRSGSGAPRAAVRPSGTVVVQVAGRGGVSASNVSAVAINITATSPTASGYLTAYASGAARPTASNLNFAKGQTVANLVIVPVGADGKIRVFNGSGGTVQLLADVAGYYLSGTPTAPGAFKSLAPARLLDTRSGSGAPRAAVRPSGTVVVQVAGRGGVSASNVSAVAINITATSPTASGYLTAYASGAARPTASNLNFAKGQTVANLVIVPVGADGKIRVFNGSGGTVQLLADVAGYYLSGTPTAPGAFKSLAPARLLDTRSGSGAPRAAVRPSGTVVVQVAGRGGVSASNVSAVAINITATSPTASGYLTAYASGAARPTASNLNFAKGQTVANLVIVPVGADGKIRVFNGSGGTVQLLADVAGYDLNKTVVPPLPAMTWTPSRVLTQSEYGLNSVSCKQDFCVATDSDYPYTYSNRNWSVGPPFDDSDNADSVSSLSCATTSFCVAVTYSQKFSVFDGDTWSPFAESTVSATDISCPTTTFCVAVGGGNAAVFDGTSWYDATHLEDGDLSTLKISCTVDHFCAAVSLFGGTAFIFDGEAWSQPEALGRGTYYALEDVSCVTSDFCIAIAAERVAFKYSNGAWSAGTTIGEQDALSGSIYHISCSSTSYCVATGSDDAVTFNGSTWTAPRTIDSDSTITSISCATNNLCVAVDQSGKSIIGRR